MSRKSTKTTEVTMNALDEVINSPGRGAGIDT
jgi:hypothetical protein